MARKVVKLNEVKQHSKAFLLRCIITFGLLSAILLITSISTYSKYGYRINGVAHHSYLDYPNEISSKDAIELSKFMELLAAHWEQDKNIDHPFDKEIEKMNEKHWAKEIDVKDRYVRSSVIQGIAKEMGLPTDKFRAVPSPTLTSKIKHGFQNNIAFPPDYLKIKKPPKPHVPQCDMTTLHHHKSTVFSFSSQQYRTTNIKLDGSFSDGGKINVLMATAAEDVINTKNNIRLNLTLYAQSSELTNHVSVTQLENEDTLTKSIHINSHLKTSACLVYNLDIIFPSKLASYKNFNLKVNHAHLISGDLKLLNFKKFNIGLGRGAINFQNIKADQILIGTLNGIVLGNYFPLQTLGAATVKGATNIEISPQSKYLKSTVVALDGPVKATVTDYGGISKNNGFIAHCWLCEPEIVSTFNPPQYIHVTSSRRKSIKIGYFNEVSSSTSAHINVHSRYGESKLVYT